MEDVTYESLNSLWLDWHNRYLDWHRKIIINFRELRSLVEKRLNAPAEPIVLDSPRFYVDIVNIADEKSPREIHFKNVTKDEEVIVGLSFIFEHSPQSKPKKLFYFQIAARYYNNIPQICFWDSSSHTRDDSFPWTDDIEKFTSEIISRIITKFKYSPFVGIKEKPKIGFIES